MDILKTIAERQSCRTYNGLRLDKATTEELIRMAATLPPLFDDVATPVIRLVDNDEAEGNLGTYGFITGARQFLVMASGKSPRERVQAGFMFEAMVLRATSLGLGTCWLGGTFNRGAFAEAMGDLDGGREVSIVSPVGHSTPKRRFAERLMRRVVKSDRRKPFGELFKGVDAESQLGRVLQGVRLAPSSSNSQPWRVTVTQEKGDGQASRRTVVRFDCATDNRFSDIDMGIAYCHFLLSSAQEGLSWKVENTSTPLSLSFSSL